MRKEVITRLVVLLILIGLTIYWVSHSSLTDTKLNLIMTSSVAGITAIYALLTFEIMQQNQSMARASIDSSVTMERSLRFSHNAVLMFSTVSVRDPTFATHEGRIRPIDNDDYRRALAQASDGGQQSEFVFALLRNMGQGPATSISLTAAYAVTDSSSPNRNSTVQKSASLPIIEAKAGVAMCIFIAKIPTSDDAAALVSAEYTYSDFYREAISEPPVETRVIPDNHHLERDTSCVINIS